MTTTDQHLRALIREEVFRILHDSTTGGGSSLTLESGGGLAGSGGGEDGGAGGTGGGEDSGGSGAAGSGDGGSTSGDSGGDSMTPTYLTIDSTGRIGADFTGLVHAQGLNLDAGISGTPPSQDRIRWLRTTDGALIVDMLGYNNASAVASEAEWTVHEPTTGLSAALDLVAEAGTAPNGLRELVRAFVGNNSVTILNDLLGSSFVTNAGGAVKQLSLAAGNAVINFPNSANATDFNVAHGLGRIPAAVVLTRSQAAGGSELTNFYAVSSTSSQFTIEGRANVVLNGNISVGWIAAG